MRYNVYREKTAYERGEVIVENVTDAFWVSNSKWN